MAKVYLEWAYAPPSAAPYHGTVTLWVSVKNAGKEGASGNVYLNADGISKTHSYTIPSGYDRGTVADTFTFQFEMPEHNVSGKITADDSENELSFTVKIANPPKIYLSATPPPGEILKGTTVTLSWNIEGATSAEIRYGPYSDKVDPKSGSKSYVVNENVTFTLVASNDAGSSYDSVSYTVKEIAPPTPPAPPPTPKHTLTIKTTTGGTTEPTPGSYTYNEGTQVKVTAKPDSGYAFDYWLVDGSKSTDNPVTITMNSNKTVEAHFKSAPPPPPPSGPPLGTKYTLFLSAGLLQPDGSILFTLYGVQQGGTTDPPPGTYYYSTEKEVTLTAKPFEGNRFSHWWIRYVTTDRIEKPTANPIKITVNEKYIEVIAVFEGIPTGGAPTLSVPPPTVNIIGLKIPDMITISESEAQTMAGGMLIGFNMANVKGKTYILASSGSGSITFNATNNEKTQVKAIVGVTLYQAFQEGQNIFYQEVTFDAGETKTFTASFNASVSEDNPWFEILVWTSTSPGNDYIQYIGVIVPKISLYLDVPHMPDVIDSEKTYDMYATVARFVSTKQESIVTGVKIVVRFILYDDKGNKFYESSGSVIDGGAVKPDKPLAPGYPFINWFNALVKNNVTSLTYEIYVDLVYIHGVKFPFDVRPTKRTGSIQVKAPPPTPTPGAPGTFTLYIEVQPKEGGTTDPAPGAVPVVAGNRQTVKAIPNSGWEFDHWEIYDPADSKYGYNGGSVPQITLLMDRDKKVIAYFKGIPTPGVVGNINGHVYEQKTRKPIAGVSVGIAGMETKTDSSGYYEFKDVPAGTQLLVVYGRGTYDSTPIDVNLSTQVTIIEGQTVTKDIYVMAVAPPPTPPPTAPPTPPPAPPPPTGQGSISFVVYDSDNYVRLKAKITIAGKTYDTNENGELYLTLDPGTYTFTVSVPGYYDTTDTFELRAGDMLGAQVPMKRLPTTPPPTAPPTAAPTIPEKIVGIPTELVIVGLIVAGIGGYAAYRYFKKK